jgi:hypothetical protein
MCAIGGGTYPGFDEKMGKIPNTFKLIRGQDGWPRQKLVQLGSLGASVRLLMQ